MSSSNYPSDWDQRRKRVYRRDDFECSNCGRRGGPRGDTELHAHHIVPVKSGGSHNLSNLITLCKDCHKSIHTGSKAPTKSRNHSVASTSNVRGAVNEMARSAEAFFDDFVALIQTIDDISVVPKEQKLETVSGHLDSLRGQISQIKRNLNQFEKHEKIQQREGELPELVDDYVNTHRELVQLVVEYIEVVDTLLKIFELTRQARCPNCTIGEALVDGTCGKCGTELIGPDDSVWRRFREAEKEGSEISNEFVIKSDEAVSTADSIAEYFD